jgi:hypothetical protein
MFCAASHCASWLAASPVSASGTLKPAARSASPASSTSAVSQVRPLIPG